MNEALAPFPISLHGVILIKHGQHLYIWNFFFCFVFLLLYSVIFLIWNFL